MKTSKDITEITFYMMKHSTIVNKNLKGDLDSVSICGTPALPWTCSFCCFYFLLFVCVLFLISIYLSIWLHQVLTVACWIFDLLCSMQIL